MPVIQPLHIAVLAMLVRCLHVLHSRERAPTDLPEDAASFNLAIAPGTLIGRGQIATEPLAQYASVGQV